MNILGQLQNAINQFNENPGNFSTVSAQLPDGTIVSSKPKPQKDVKVSKGD